MKFPNENTCHKNISKLTFDSKNNRFSKCCFWKILKILSQVWHLWMTNLQNLANMPC